MTQEEKQQLLLIDLSARFPYNVAVDCRSEESRFTCYLTIDMLREIQNNRCYWEYKPYLFPLSNMTEKQREELYKIGWYLDEDKIYSCFRNYDDSNYKTHIDSFELINWCYKNNFDINGLIPKGLANDAAGLNIY